MALLSVLPVAEAAAFTMGCIVLDTHRFDTERVGAALVAVASILALALLVVATPVEAADAVGIDPDEVSSILG